MPGILTQLVMLRVVLVFLSAILMINPAQNDTLILQINGDCAFFEIINEEFQIEFEINSIYLVLDEEGDIGEETGIKIRKGQLHPKDKEFITRNRDAKYKTEAYLISKSDKEVLVFPFGKVKINLCDCFE